LFVTLRESLFYITIIRDFCQQGVVNCLTPLDGEFEKIRQDILPSSQSHPWTFKYQQWKAVYSYRWIWTILQHRSR